MSKTEKDEIKNFWIDTRGPTPVAVFRSHECQNVGPGNASHVEFYITEEALTNRIQNREKRGADVSVSREALTALGAAKRGADPSPGA